jgi:single-strand selective monofunctional uracil DNA glycosylase
VSGQRLWGWVQARFGSAAPFFERFWVHNYCPLLFVEASGKNRTPDKLTAIEKDSVISACNMALRAIMALLQPRLVVGVGVTLSFALLFQLFYDLMNHASSIISLTGLKI